MDASLVTVVAEQLKPLFVRRLSAIVVRTDGRTATALLSFALYKESTRGVRTDDLPEGITVTSRERSAGPSGLAELLGQPRLADPRLSDKHHQAAVSGPRLAKLPLESLSRRPPPRALLHRDRAADGVGGGGKRYHQAVTEPLHLLASVRRHGLSEQLVVRCEDALRALVARAFQ